MSRETLGWTLYAVVLISIIVAAYRQTLEADRAHERLEQFKQREAERDKPPRRTVSGPGVYIGKPRGP